MKPTLRSLASPLRGVKNRIDYGQAAPHALRAAETLRKKYPCLASGVIDTAVHEVMELWRAHPRWLERELMRIPVVVSEDPLRNVELASNGLAWLVAVNAEAWLLGLEIIPPWMFPAWATDAGATWIQR